VRKGFEERDEAPYGGEKTRKVNNCLEKLQAILEPWIQEMKVIYGAGP
jgi:hypothetical protein